MDCDFSPSSPHLLPNGLFSPQNRISFELLALSGLLGFSTFKGGKMLIFQGFSNSRIVREFPPFSFKVRIATLTRNAVDRKVSRVRIPNSPPQKACNHADYRLFYFCPKDKPARFSVFRGENQLFSPVPIDPQRLPKSPPSGRASPVSIACAEVILDL